MVGGAAAAYGVLRMKGVPEEIASGLMPTPSPAPAPPVTTAPNPPAGPVPAPGPAPIPATEPPPAPAPATTVVASTADSGPEAPTLAAQASEDAGAEVGGTLAASAAPEGKQEEEEDSEEDEEALLKQQEPDIAEKVIGADAAPPVVAVAPARPSSPAPSVRSPVRPPARPTVATRSPAREPQSVRIDSRPVGAVIKLGTRVLGRAPMNLRFNPGITYELTFVKSGYQSTRKRFTASGRKGQRVSASLKKRPTPTKRRNFFQRLFGR